MHLSHDLAIIMIDVCQIYQSVVGTLLNPFPANVDNMASSYQCKQMADGI